MPKVTWGQPKKPKTNTLAALLRTYKKENGITSSEMADKLFCTPENVRKKMNQPAGNWKIGELFSFCDVLGVPYGDALTAAIESK